MESAEDGMSNMKRIIISLSLLSLGISCTEKVSSESYIPEKLEQGEYQSVTMEIPSVSFDDDYPMTKINLDLNSLKIVWVYSQTLVAKFISQWQQASVSQ